MRLTRCLLPQFWSRSSWCVSPACSMKIFWALTPLSYAMSPPSNCILTIRPFLEDSRLFVEVLTLCRPPMDMFCILHTLQIAGFGKICLFELRELLIILKLFMSMMGLIGFLSNILMSLLWLWALTKNTEWHKERGNRVFGTILYYMDTIFVYIRGRLPQIIGVFG